MAKVVYSEIIKTRLIEADWCRFDSEQIEGNIVLTRMTVEPNIYISKNGCVRVGHAVAGNLISLGRGKIALSKIQPYTVPFVDIVMREWGKRQKAAKP